MTTKLPVSITEEEFTQLIKHTLKPHHKLAFLLGFGAGMRISEIVHLTANEVNLQNRSILVKQGKGGKDRVVPLPKGFKEEHLKRLPIKCGQRSLERAFISAAKRSGLKEKKTDVHFHSLRHGFASNCLDKGIPLHQVQLLMGHSNVATTSIYLHANPKDALKNYEELF